VTRLDFARYYIGFVPVAGIESLNVGTEDYLIPGRTKGPKDIGHTTLPEGFD